MSQAEHLLIRTNLTMGQIAQTISRTTSNRFAELFKKHGHSAHRVPKARKTRIYIWR